tara:strand:+ start:216 stop:569 length:354 start_codon:yes stop_codon:yes gene_type:complete
MGKLTTHVLDTSAGKPASGIHIELLKLEGKEKVKITNIKTNSDGRCDTPLINGDDFLPGEYELVFHVGAFFERTNKSEIVPEFLNIVPVRFKIVDCSENYHVPLLISPFGYTTYRGS